ncbi:MAG TPA: hypothetical protein VGI86_21105, partial [Acidimicrobiia bacterium]
MVPEVQVLETQLGAVAVRNTAAEIADRVRAARARKRDRETIAELEEIVSSLLDDKRELVRIAQAYEQELVAQRISADDIAYISSNVVPIVQELAESAGDDQGDNNIGQVIDLLRPLLSVETV